ncbi:MAG: carboxymuconolactone decarboxylase family protein [Rhodoplanes sp.]|uniref:carboxymuconolactone decarboxylase family protein n=1 Tax=Rhodoplanes sp. TaxID=1968906 RepID=UPI0018550F0A|nr:carboxymuconolactone decarboxylase family protein [Rhodoplanes sp.]NVO17294.1 carboxymuconolactone decarboxylase family protein [Rhodoplanes sp.]
MARPRRPASPAASRRGAAAPTPKPSRKTKPAPKTKASAAVPAYRLPALTEETLDPAQRALLAAMRAGPRGGALSLRGPFGVFLHAPGFGSLAQELGAHCRFGTTVPARLSEFAILVTARLWRAHYEWHVHAPIAEKAGVKPATIADLKAGRAPARAAADEKAVYAFVTELYAKKRVTDRTYARLHAIVGDVGMVEFAGILGYYALVAMTLDVFRVPLPGEAKLPFAEPKV